MNHPRSLFRDNPGASQNYAGGANEEFVGDGVAGNQLTLGMQQISYQTMGNVQGHGGVGRNGDGSARGMQLMITASDEEDVNENVQTGKYRRVLSKSEQKDARKRGPGHCSKVPTAGPSPMSFANMVDEYLDSNEPVGAPLQQILFTKDN